MPSVAIIGAGPSGCYVAQALCKARADAAITIFDALPVPYGLIRYGVAADHQGTKAVIRQFERLFERQGVRFAGNVRLGADVTLDALRAGFDAVVLATGLGADRRLGIPGEDLAGIHGAGEVTRAWNGYPDAVAPPIGRRVVVLGNGNVAIDLVRILAKGAAEFEGSDITGEPGAGVEEITIVGRSAATVARFDPVMVKELARLAGCRIAVLGAEGEGKGIEALQSLHGHAPEGAAKSLTFRFGLTPLRFLGDTAVKGVEFSDGTVIFADTVLTAIGFEGDAARDVLLADASEEGVLAPGLYATGWFRRGPRGTIPENRADALALATRIAADLPRDGGKPGIDVPGMTGFDGWVRIDAAERAAAPEGRVRAKITTHAGLMALAQNTGETGCK
ncbi:MAG: FAD-dependent oxidoreductase [Rhodobacteraceae bacterium]|jgi:ferredoxin--NADP+ reductase|nr:FAD-dependent oxidoreductase [Paracoccaceae bacterium]